MRSELTPKSLSRAILALEGAQGRLRFICIPEGSVTTISAFTCVSATSRAEVNLAEVESVYFGLISSNESKRLLTKQNGTYKLQSLLRPRRRRRHSSGGKGSGGDGKDSGDGVEGG
ncbi:unnamed protein product [Peronospora belbahrii]|uniref:Uncharacterized protein n=1 Tax=Peronospora belbahrii TaxID=622444 RepID=A0AAU9KZW4_9STRA|nr:unnamed protein product [Peronospora belbahrii]